MACIFYNMPYVFSAVENGTKTSSEIMLQRHEKFRRRQ